MSDVDDSAGDTAASESPSLMAVQTALNRVQAEHTALKTAVRQGKMVELERLQLRAATRAVGLKEKFMGEAPPRHAAMMAAKYELDVGDLGRALRTFARETLNAMARISPEEVRAERRQAAIDAGLDPDTVEQ